MNMRQIMVALIVMGMLAPCIVFGGKAKNRGKNIKIDRKEKPDVTWTIQSIEINTLANSAEASTTTNSITLKSSTDEIKKFIVHLSSIDVELNGQHAKCEDLKEGMKVEKFSPSQGTISKIVASSSGDDKTNDKKKKNKKKK